MYKLLKISEEEFCNDGKTLLFNADFPRSYGKLIIKNHTYYFSWRSNILIPEVLVKDTVLILTIDTFFSVISLNNTADFKSAETNYNIIDTCFFQEYIIVFTEIEVLKLSFKGSVIETMHLPDIFDFFKIEDKVVKIHLIDGETLTVNFFWK